MIFFSKMKMKMKMDGFAVLAVAGCVLASTAAGAYDFSDNFEGYADGSRLSGSRASTNPGITWRDSTSATVSTKVDREGKSGGKSLQFFYKGTTDRSQDAWAEQRVDLVGQYPELWISWDLLVPSNYNDRGGGNNKVMIVYNDFTGNTTFVDFESWSYGQIPGSNYLNVQYKYNGVNHDFAGTYNSPVKVDFNPFGRDFRYIEPAKDAGKWLHMVFHMKLATSAAAADGLTEVWKNGQKIVEHRNIPNFNTTANHFSGLYLLGWANTGFDQDTYFYLDNFKISDRPMQTSLGPIPNPPSAVSAL